MDWSTTLAVLAHELRAPTQVITGYTRMLAEGRLDESQRLRALAQIESAAGRIGLISRHAAELSRWQSPPGAATDGARLGDLVASAVARSASPDRVSVRLLAQDGDVRVRSLDDAALSEALTTIIDAVSREVIDDRLLVVSRACGSPAARDLLIGADALLQCPDRTAGPSGAVALSLERGGLGLALVLAVTVLDAHGASVWTVGSQTGIVGIRLRVEPSRTSP
jgi:hypothetical protein